MVSAAIGIDVLSEPLLIPVWFYSYSAAIYAASALVSLLIVFFSYRFFRMSKSKTAFLLMFSFLFLTAAFAALAFSSAYAYLYRPFFQANLDLGSLGLVNSLCFSVYYIAAVVAYLSLALMYLPKDASDFYKKLSKSTGGMFVLYLPLWYLDISDFHVLSIVLLAYTMLKNLFNFYKKRVLDNFLVMFAFLAMVSFHALLLFVPFDPTIYLAANGLLAAGFASLLAMLIRVSGSDGRRS